MHRHHAVQYLSYLSMDVSIQQDVDASTSSVASTLSCRGEKVCVWLRLDIYFEKSRLAGLRGARCGQSSGKTFKMPKEKLFFAILFMCKSDTQKVSEIGDPNV